MPQSDWTTKFMIFIVAAAIVAVAIVISMDERYATLNFAPATYDAVVDLLAPLILIALFIERGVEVFIISARRIDRRLIDEEVEALQGDIELKDQRRAELRQQLEGVGAQALSQSQRDALVEEIAKLRVDTDALKARLCAGNGQSKGPQVRLETFRARTQRIAFLASVTIGLLIALAGVRVLSPLVDVDLIFSNAFPLTVFHSVDVILTAGLLGGGASGIHQIVKVFGDQMDSLKKK